jgi:molybdopterin-binding protein
MSEFRMGEAAALLGVGVDSLRRLADAGDIATRRTSGGHRVVDGRRLAAYLAKRGGAPLAGSHAPKSARNHLAGIVTRVVRDKVMAQVEMQAGPHRIVSLMSREAADELGLAPGVLAVATVKATNVVVELAGPRTRRAPRGR